MKTKWQPHCCEQRSAPQFHHSEMRVPDDDVVGTPAKNASESPVTDIAASVLCNKMICEAAGI
jgi:hypothetical protein